MLSIISIKRLKTLPFCAFWVSKIKTVGKLKVDNNFISNYNVRKVGHFTWAKSKHWQKYWLWADKEIARQKSGSGSWDYHGQGVNVYCRSYLGPKNDDSSSLSSKNQRMASKSRPSLDSQQPWCLGQVSGCWVGDCCLLYIDTSPPVLIRKRILAAAAGVGNF